MARRKITKVGTNRNGSVFVAMYAEAGRMIREAIDRFDPKTGNFTPLRNEIDAITSDLEAVNKQFADVVIPDQYAQGLAEVSLLLNELGIKFEEPDRGKHQAIVARLSEEVSLDFARNLQAYQNGIQRAISEAQKVQIREAFAKGIQKGRTQDAAIGEIKQILEEKGLQSIVDRGGRFWTIDRYAEMLGRTKMREAYNTGIINRSLETNTYVFRVSFSGTRHDECRRWENKLVSLNGEFGLPKISAAEASGLFHPNCFHILLAAPLEQQELERKSS